MTCWPTMSSWARAAGETTPSNMACYSTRGYKMANNYKIKWDRHLGVVLKILLDIFTWEITWLTVRLLKLSCDTRVNLYDTITRPLSAKFLCLKFMWVTGSCSVRNYLCEVSEIRNNLVGWRQHAIPLGYLISSYIWHGFLLL